MSVTPPADTYQVTAIKMMKANIVQIVAVLDRYAGTSSSSEPKKQGLGRDQIRALRKPLDQYLAGIAASRHWSASMLQLWQQFDATWKDGKGDWTKSAQIAKVLKGIFNNIEA